MSSIRFSIDLGISNSTGLVRKYVNIDGFHSGDSIDLMVFFFFLVCFCVFERPKSRPDG